MARDNVTCECLLLGECVMCMCVHLCVRMWLHVFIGVYDALRGETLFTYLSET